MKPNIAPDKLMQTHNICLYVYINKSAASTASCPATALTSSKCYNSVKKNMCSSCYVPLHFCKASRKSLNPFSSYGGHTYMTWITTDNVQRMITPEAGNSELPFLCFANCIMVIYICTKFQENISNSFQVRVDTNILQKSLLSKFKGP